MRAAPDPDAGHWPSRRSLPTCCPCPRCTPGPAPPTPTLSLSLTKFGHCRSTRLSEEKKDALNPLSPNDPDHDADILNPDARRVRDAARNCGVRVDFHEYPGMFHNWTMQPIPEGRRARRQLYEFLDRMEAGT